MTSISLAMLARRAADLAIRGPAATKRIVVLRATRRSRAGLGALRGDCPAAAGVSGGGDRPAVPFGVWGGEIFEKGRIIAYKRPRGHPGRQARAAEAGLLTPAC